MDMQGEQIRSDLQLVWGAEGIGQVLGLPRRKVYYMLRKGLIKAARKCGDQHYADIPGLRQQFCSTEQSAARAVGI